MILPQEDLNEIYGRFKARKEANGRQGLQLELANLAIEMVAEQIIAFEADEVITEMYWASRAGNYVSDEAYDAAAAMQRGIAIDLDRAGRRYVFGRAILIRLTTS